MTNKYLIILFFTLIISIGGKTAIVKGGNSISDSTSYYTTQILPTPQQSKSFPKKSYQKITKNYQHFKQQNDTVRCVQCLLNMAQIQKEKGKFSLSFDHLWEAQYLTKNRTNPHQKAKVLIQLARLYDDFNMNDEALIQLEEALQISKQMYFENNKDVENLNASYVNLAVRQRKLGNYQQAFNYLDSCIYLHNSSLEMPFLDAERGILLVKLGRHNEASAYLRAALKNAEQQNASYKINIYIYLGELNMALSEPDSAIMYFNKALSFSHKNHLGKNLIPDVLMKLSEIYVSQGKFNRAYKYMAQSKTVSDSLIQQKNTTNSDLFEIKNSYLKSINERDELLKKQNIVLSQNRQIQLRLKIILALVVLLGIVLFVVIRTRLKLKRTLHEKKETELKAEITEERSKAEIDAKSKELTSYALQLIDKDSAIDELLKVLQTESPSHYKSMNNKYKKGSKDLWDEFNLRFTKVNSDFYDRLTSQHPTLSITEQKHCALIKLKFATKEMARILSIEPHSVHMSRSRIRKKIGMQRSDSLEDYIAQL